MARTMKLFRLPENPKTPGFRQLQQDDCGQVVDLLNDYLAKFNVASQFSLEDIQHW